MTYSLTEVLSSISEEDVAVFLLARPEYQKTLQLAVKHEAEHATEPYYLGWQWFDVETHPTKLMRLVTDGIAKVKFKSNRTTGYLLKDKEAVKKALSSFSLSMSDSKPNLTSQMR